MMQSVGGSFYYSGPPHHGLSTANLTEVAQYDGIGWTVHGGTLNILNGSLDDYEDLIRQYMKDDNISRIKEAPLQDVPVSQPYAFINTKENPIEGKYVVALKKLPSDQWYTFRADISNDDRGAFELGLVLCANADLSSYYRVELGKDLDDYGDIVDNAASGVVLRVAGGQTTKLPLLNTNPQVFGDFRDRFLYVYNQPSYQDFDPDLRDSFTPTNVHYYFTDVPNLTIVGPGVGYGTGADFLRVTSWTNKLGRVFSVQGHLFLDKSPLSDGNHAGFYLEKREIPAAPATYKGLFPFEQGTCYKWSIDNGDGIQAHCSLSIDASPRVDHNPHVKTKNEFAATPTGAGGVPPYTGVRVDEDYNNYPNGVAIDWSTVVVTDDDIPGGQFDNGPDPATLPPYSWA